MEIYVRAVELFLLALPIACISWTVTHEEVFREPREYCIYRSLNDTSIWKRKFFFLFTCEYCFSHYVTILFLFITGFKLHTNNWTGYLISGFSLVWVSNFYTSVFSLIRQGIKKEKTEIKVLEKESES